MSRILQILKAEEIRPGVSEPTMRVRPESAPPTPTADGTAAARENPSPTAEFPGFPAARHCDEKGCVFPAAGSGNNKCLVHDRETHEPEHFESFQPTVLLLDRARFGLPDPETEPDDSRSQDRHRQAAEREAFLEDVA